MFPIFPGYEKFLIRKILLRTQIPAPFYSISQFNSTSFSFYSFSTTTTSTALLFSAADGTWSI